VQSAPAMAMPTDFWRNDQMLNIFRTKPCQRLARDGVCGWRSQCQFSHSPEWPRRQPRRYNYSPELCPHIRVVKAHDGTEQIVNSCSAGLRCPWAHSKEEVLFHPHVFKTALCEEHTNNVGNNQGKNRNAKKNRCHRYYCPFAHGSDELRISSLSVEQRDSCLSAMEVFPSDVCCQMCTRHWLTPPVTEQTFQDRNPLAFDIQGPPLPWPQKAPQAQVGHNHPWDVLSTVPDQKQSKEFFDKILDKWAIDARAALKPIQKPTEDPFVMPYEQFGGLSRSLFYTDEPLSSLRVSNLTNDSPAFIDVVRQPIGQKLPMKSPEPEKTHDVLGDYYYAML